MPKLPTRIGGDDPNRYAGLADPEIASELRFYAARLLMRGRLETLLVRREIGGLLTEFARRHARDRARFEAFAQRTIGMGYDEGRRHMQLWVNWQRCFDALDRLQSEAARANRPFTVPGLRKLLTLAGVVGARPRLEGVAAIPPIEQPRPAVLPNDVRELQRMVRRFQGIEREFRARIVVLIGERDYFKSRARHFQADAASLRLIVRQMPNRATAR